VPWATGNVTADVESKRWLKSSKILNQFFSQPFLHETRTYEEVYRAKTIGSGECN
jgi:hypothetical protein